MPKEDAVQDYQVYRVVPGSSAAMALGMSYGLFEVVAFPAMLADVACQWIVGNDIRMYYNANGGVAMCRLEGRFLSGHGLSQPGDQIDSPALPPVALDAMLTLIP